MAKQMKAEQKYDKEVVAACRNYKKAIHAAEAATSSREQKLWVRAAAAYGVYERCEEKGISYQRPASVICGVPKSSISMDVKVEMVRGEVGLKPSEMPSDSVSAMYQLYRGRELAMKVAGSNPESVACVNAKVKKIAMAIKKGNISVRKVGVQFAVERKKFHELRRANRPVPEIAKDALHPPKVERLDADGMRGKLESVHVPTSATVPVLTIVPPDCTAQGIEAYFADARMREEVSRHTPARGGMWIFIDLRASEKVAADTTAPAGPVAPEVVEPSESSKPTTESATVDTNDPEVPAPVKLVKRDKRKGKKAA